MTAKSRPLDRRLDLDPHDAGFWRRYLDAAVDRGLSELRSDLARIPGDIDAFLGVDLDTIAAAMAGALLSIEDDGISRDQQDLLFGNLQQFTPALREVGGEEDLRDLEEAIDRSRDRKRLLEDLSRAGREDWAAFLRARERARTLHREKNERDTEGAFAWAKRLVEGHRQIFRWVAFYDRARERPLVRLLLGLLLADRMGLLRQPAQAGPGRPPVEEVTLPLVVEVLLFPEVPRREEALAAHVPGLPRPTPRGVLDAALTALELPSWGSPREPIVRALAAAGHSWASVYLSDAPPGAKHRYKAHHQSQIRNARTRAFKDGQYGGPEALLHAAAVPLLKTGTVREFQGDGKTLAILVPGIDTLLRPLP